MKRLIIALAASALSCQLLFAAPPSARSNVGFAGSDTGIPSAPAKSNAATAPQFNLATGSWVGWARVTIVIDASGNASIAIDPTLAITVTGSGTGPTPPAPPQPPVPPAPNLTERGVAIRDAALRATSDPNRASTAQDLSDLYHEIAKMVRAGTIKGQAVIAQVVSFGSDKVLSQAGSPAAAWKPMRDVLGTQWVKLAQETPTDNEAFAKLLDEAGDGVAASIPPNQMASPQARQINIARIIEIIMVVMKLLGLIPATAGAPPMVSLPVDFDAPTVVLLARSNKRQPPVFSIGGGVA